MNVVIWISSFIPKQIPSLTKSVPGNPDKTMFEGPTKCYLTDQRTFAADPTASARSHLLVEIAFGQGAPVRKVPRCNRTTEVECDTGVVTCNDEPDASRLRIDNFRAVTPTKTTFTFAGGANNPCVSLSPDIDWLVHVVVDKLPNGVKVTISPGSLVEPFPAFECYARFSGATKALFQRPPNPGATPWNLPGPPNQPVTGTAQFP